MKLRQAEPREGIAWVGDAFRVFRRYPFAFASLLATFLLVFVVLASVPVVGEVVWVLLTPIGSLVFMVASRRAAEAQPPLPVAFVELGRIQRRDWIELLKLGLASLVAALASTWIVAVVDGGSFAGLREALSAPTPDMLDVRTRLLDPRLQLAASVFLLLAGLLSVPFWHAPALVLWGRQTFAKSMFSSTVAIWRNKAAFLVYGLVWTAAAFAFAAGLGIVVALAGPRLATFLVTPLVLVFWTVVYTSLWFTFAGCFTADEPRKEIA